MSAALIDAGPLVAVFGRDQPSKQHYLSLLSQASSERWHLSTTWPCVVEASYLLAVPQRYTLLRWLGAHAISVFPTVQEDLEDCVDVMVQYTEMPRTEMDLADATLYHLALETGVKRIMTLDARDFSRYRFPDGSGFQIL